MNNEQKALVQLDEEGQTFESFDYDEVQAVLEEEIRDSLDDLKLLEEDRKKINSPEGLSDAVENIVWEQFCLQLGVGVGEEGIEKNGGQTMDLSYEAHVQTSENFANGKIATHNRYIDYKKRYNDWQANFERDAQGNIKMHDTRTGRKEANLVRGARKDFDKGRPVGSKGKGIDIDHDVSAGELIRDPEVNCYISREDQVKFANSEKNLHEMKSDQNRSKGDLSMKEWLENPNKKGQKPEEIFDISKKDKKKLLKKDKEARDELERLKKQGKKQAEETGKQSRKDEAKLFAGETFKAMFLALLADLLRTIIGKLVIWFKSANRKLKVLVKNVKEAIKDFFFDIKKRFATIVDVGTNAVCTFIFGPIVATIKKAWMFIREAGKSVKKAFEYFKDPCNSNKPFDMKIKEVGKIIVAGFTTVGAILSGEFIAKGLMSVPFFAIEIPLLGSIANILGIFLGGVVCGLLGAIVINYIDRKIAEQEKNVAMQNILLVQSNIMRKQEMLNMVAEKNVQQKEVNNANKIQELHKKALESMKNSVIDIKENRDVLNKNQDVVIKMKEDVEDSMRQLKEDSKSIDSRLDALLHESDS